MADDVSPRYASAVPEEETSGWAVGFILFAGLMMIMSGIFQAFSGLVALFNDNFFVATRDYLYQFDLTTWGWIHLIGGALIALAGWAVLAGQTWGRVIGVILAILSAIANFAFLPYYPLWSLTIIALDVFVIWALVAHGRSARAY
jgi:hypothetical protein